MFNCLVSEFTRDGQMGENGVENEIFGSILEIGGAVHSQNYPCTKDSEVPKPRL